MPKSRMLTISLPGGADPAVTRDQFSQVAARHGFTTKHYHKDSEVPSPGAFILAINAGEVITTLFQEEDYQQALDALRPFAEDRQAWACSLVAGIEAAYQRWVESEEAEVEEYRVEEE